MSTPNPLEDRIEKLEKSLKRVERILGLQQLGGVSTDDGEDGGGLSTRSIGCAHSALSVGCLVEEMAES
ncbi:hypothetical protein FVA95_11725 [Pseudonocardia sp. EV170527-09]|uniref:hypothetical protein n=1 Tax=Pseudonocardia sp. EV170527-09 TaxID=2603411 RepID=UPI0011F0BCD0|nr:hypothetical protein [Pseudonocardia sp. EV170527-09]KAA1029124.1 hypothetical protein FVA95_11725 [Pseudonocardia sp. EV170527-09]